MAVSTQFNTFALDLMGSVARVSARRMFGGIGYYADGLFFALAHQDLLYFRVDDLTRGDYEREGMSAFSPMGPGTRSMRYYTVPPRLYEDEEELAVWMRRALQVARTAQLKARPRRPRA